MKRACKYFTLKEMTNSEQHVSPIKIKFRYMKTVFTLMLIIVSITISTAQEKNIETQSVSIENLIGFIVEQYKLNVEEASEAKNITFLIQASENNSIEDAVILKQAFKLLSKRLTEDDVISIVTYSGINGVALSQCPSKDIKKMLYVINNLKESIKEFHEDGIELAYAHAKKNFIESAVNSVVMIRNPNASKGLAANANSNKTKNTKKKSNAVMLTAIALLPELIAVIKD